MLLLVCEIFDFVLVGFLLAAVTARWQLTFGQTSIVLLAFAIGAINRIARFYQDRGELVVLPFDLRESNFPTVALTRADDGRSLIERQAMIDIVKRVYGECFE